MNARGGRSEAKNQGAAIGESVEIFRQFVASARIYAFQGNRPLRLQTSKYHDLEGLHPQDRRFRSKPLIPRSLI